MSYHGTQKPANDACMTKREASLAGRRLADRRSHLREGGPHQSQRCFLYCQFSRSSVERPCLSNLQNVSPVWSRVTPQAEFQGEEPPKKPAQRSTGKRSPQRPNQPRNPDRLRVCQVTRSAFFRTDPARRTKTEALKSLVAFLGYFCARDAKMRSPQCYVPHLELIFPVRSRARTRSPAERHRVLHIAR